MTRRAPKRLAVLTLVIIGVATFTLTRGCAATYDNRNPTGEAFPSVTGKSLTKETTQLPEALAGQPAILLVGYKQSTQFDIDRWILGLLQAEADARIVEVPTIPGLVTSLASGWIDDGMRSGIPSEDWGSVVTLYADAATPVAKLTGNRKGRNARVLVLNAQGEIVWFSDRGYSATQVLDIARVVETLREKHAPE